MSGYIVANRESMTYDEKRLDDHIADYCQRVLDGAHDQPAKEHA